jgi:hypothetical protein
VPGAPGTAGGVTYTFTLTSRGLRTPTRVVAHAVRSWLLEYHAAGPQLLRELGRHRTSSDPVARSVAAIVDATVDCYRAGYATPISETLPLDAHQLYLPANSTAVAYQTRFPRRRHRRNRCSSVADRMRD